MAYLPVKPHKKTATEEKLLSYNLPQNIKLQALEVLGEIQREENTRTFKQKSKASVIFACVFLAYHREGITADPKFIVKFLGLEKEKINIDRTLNKYAKDVKINIPALTSFYVDRYIEMLGDLDRKELINEILEFINSCSEDTEDNVNVIRWMNTNYLTNIVIGITTFYLDVISKHDFKSKIWSEACNLTTSCINKYKNSFEEMYNM